MYLENLRISFEDILEQTSQISLKAMPKKF